MESFIDTDVHDVLKHSGYSNHDFGEDISGGEWFPVSLEITSHSDIDWSKSIPEIDQQLYAKYNLSPEEISFIEKMIKPME